jgi:hypothetical protein
MSSSPLDRRTFLRHGGLAAAGIAAAAAGLGTDMALAAPATATPTATTPSGPRRVPNLPDTFYRRPGLATMPRIDYASMPVVNVRDFGATGDGATADNAAFAGAVAALGDGGGVVYVPPGRYRFTPAPAPNVQYWQITNHNVHFVGEGEASIIQFDQPGLADDRYPFLQGWNFAGTNNVSIRALAFTWTPYFLMRDSYPLFSVVIDGGDGFQAIGALFDQGQPGLWMNQGGHKWVVDCVVRNIAADGIHFESVTDSAALYNWVEHVYDDGVANVTNTRSTPDTSILKNVYFGYNTVISVPWGRGVTLGGADQVTEHNWVESINSAGVFSTVGNFAGEPSAYLYDSTVRDNTLVRNNLTQRDDNAFYGYGTGGYQSSIAIMDLIQGLTLDSNKVYGSTTNGITLGIEGWFGINATDVVIRDNIVQDTTGAGIRVVPAGHIDGFALEGNTILDTAGASVQVDGALTGVSTADNEVSVAPAVAAAGSVSGDFDGFTLTGATGAYRDIYREFRVAAGETAWEAPPAYPVPTAGLPRANVRAFGARGDGGINDLAAFRRALDSLPASGGVLYVPPGRYRLEPDPNHDSVPFSRVRHHLLVSGRSNIHVVGAGLDSVLLFTGADHHGLRFVDVTGCSVGKLRLELAQAPALRRNRALLEISAARSTVIADLTAVGSAGTGVRVDSSRGVRVRNVTVLRAGTYGIEVAASRQVLVEGCTVSGSRDNGIESSWVGSIMLETQYIRITGNRIDGTLEGAGIGVVGGDQVVVNGNQIWDSYLAGLYLYARCGHYPPKHVELTGNTLTGTNTGRLSYTPGAIAVHSLERGRTSADVLISRNIVTATPYAGIWVGGQTPRGDKYAELDRLVISGNQVTGATGPAIDISEPQRSHITQLSIS